MTKAARWVLNDCEEALKELLHNDDVIAWRRRWATVVVLLRAVGNGSKIPKNLMCSLTTRSTRTQQPVLNSSFNRSAFSAPSSLRLAVGPVNSFR